MSNNDGNDDGVVKLKGGKESSMLEKAMNAVEKARKESFENKLKDKAKLLMEAEKSVRLIKREMAQIQADFEEGM